MGFWFVTSKGRNGSDKSYRQPGRLGHLPVTLAWGGFEQGVFNCGISAIASNSPRTARYPSQEPRGMSHGLV